MVRPCGRSKTGSCACAITILSKHDHRNCRAKLRRVSTRRQVARHRAAASLRRKLGHPVLLIEAQLARAVVVGEKLRIPPPVDHGLELPAGFLAAERVLEI